MKAEISFDSVAPPGPRPRAVRPRHAATLILVRRGGPAPRVLMGRRHTGHSFMPGKWVFPGGQIDPGDFRAPFVGALKPETAHRLGAGLSLSRARALVLTAIRETYEETGLVLGRAAGEIPRRGGAWGDFLAHGRLPDLSVVDMVARAITPPHLPRRYDARFLMAPAEALLSLKPGPHCGEFDEIAWVTLTEADKLDLPGVTRAVLHDLDERMRRPGKPALLIRMVAGRMRRGEF